MSEKMYTMDAAMPSRMHSGHVEHDELEISDAELKRLKARAAKAVTMDEAPTERVLPEEYRRCLQPHLFDRPSYDEWLSGKDRR